ncbi:MAG TPA: hypothetical protein VJ697_07990 [Nitrososphaeraceae archaeon]|nr:hypothetical protein [Nitrososphaeraceae archaeon]
MSFQTHAVFILYKNQDVNTLLAGTFWLKGLESFKFIDGKECLKKFREMDRNVDALVLSHEIALDNDLRLIDIIKRINSITKVLVIADKETKKNNIYNYGADEIVILPSSPTDISDKLLLLISKRSIIEKSTTDLV